MSCCEQALPDSRFCTAHREYYVKYNRNRHAEIKKQVVLGYGSKCQCSGGCDESRPEFLSLDHVFNDGAERRKKFGNKEVGRSLYQRLIKEGFPKEYQLLCYNCNCAKGFYGECPHVVEKQTAQKLAAAGGQ